MDVSNNIDIPDVHKKIVQIVGTNNKYMLKKVTREKVPELKKRVVSKEWTFSEEYFKYNKQLQILNDIISNNYINEDNAVTKIIIQQINKKISSYKQQDIIKQKLNIEKFITFQDVIHKMIECGLKCRYCICEMFVLYDISREMKQWSVDRVNNSEGHNQDNFHLACLECNLKRRKRTDEHYLFTKQLKLVKQDD